VLTAYINTKTRSHEVSDRRGRRGRRSQRSAPSNLRSKPSLCSVLRVFRVPFGRIRVSLSESKLLQERRERRGDAIGRLFLRAVAEAFEPLDADVGQVGGEPLRDGAGV